MKMRIGKFFGCCVLVLLVSGSWVGVAEAAECVSPDMPLSCHETIQEALAVADPGEEVAVHPGIYEENISVDTIGVQVVGRGWWPGQVVIKPAAGVAATLNAAQTTLKNVAVRGGEAGVVVNGAGVVIYGVHVENTQTGILVSADNVQVINSSIRLTDGHGISAAGAGLVVRSALVQRAGGVCIDVSGDGALVENSRLFDCGEQGVKISGSAAAVLKNDLRVAGGYLVHVVGPGARVRGNRLRGGRDAAIRVVSDSPDVVKNSARDCESGIDVYCTSCVGGQVAGNVARGTYNCPGFIVEADAGGLHVQDNTSHDSLEEGFNLSGVGMVVRDNRAFNNGRDGFVLYSSAGVQFLDNRANKNARDGIRIESGATGTIVKRNRAHANGGVDFHDAGTGTILGEGSGRNSFGTVGGP